MSAQPNTSSDTASGSSWRIAAEVSAWFVAALGLRAALATAANPGFDGLWGQDSWGYLEQARGLLRWSHGGALPVARWPQGYPLLGVLLHQVGLGLPRAMQAASVLAGAATVPLVWLAGRAWWPAARPAVPRLAAALVAVAPVHLVWSLCATSDTAAVAWLAAGAWMIGRAGATRRPSAWIVGASASLALGCATRLAAGLAIPAFVLAVLLGRQRWRRMSVAAVTFLAVLGPQIMLWLKAPRESVIHPWLLGWRPWHAWQRVFDTVDGLATYPWPQGVFALFPAIHPGYLGLVGGLLAAVGLVTLIHPSQAITTEQPPVHVAPGQPARGFWLAWVAVVTIFFAGMPFQNFRFGLIVLMPWALLAALGAARLAQRSRVLAVGLVLATVVVQGVWTERLLRRHVTMAAARTAAARQIDAILPKNAQVIAFGLTADLAQRSGRAVVELATSDADALARLWPSAVPVFVVVDAERMRSQWRGKPVAHHLEWLRTHSQLVIIHRVGPWGIWEAKR